MRRVAEIHIIERNAESVRGVLDDAAKNCDECDSIIVLMQKKTGGIRWFALNSMRLETVVFMLWSALRNFGKM